MNSSLLVVVAVAAAAAISARAEVSGVSPSGFLVTHRAEVVATPQTLYRAFSRVGEWWNEAHTYSGNAAHLRIDMNAGGCFCERWNQDSIEHARVLYVAQNKRLRMEGALGPLQDMAVNGVMDFALAAQGEKTELKFTYRVRGSPDSALDKVAAIVDRVMSEQVRRLVSFAEGRPLKPLPAAAALADKHFDSAGVRIRYVEDGGGKDAVVLLHDRGSALDAQWIDTGVLRALAEQQIFRVVALDLRGHGKSGKPEGPAVHGTEMALDVARLMDHLGIARAHLVGYGLGAQVAAYLAAREPARFVSLTLAGGAARRTAEADDEGQPSTRELALSDAELAQVTVPTLGIAGTQDPAMRNLAALRPAMPRLVRLVSLDGETHITAPRQSDFVSALQHFLRYHPASLAK